MNQRKIDRRPASGCWSAWASGVWRLAWLLSFGVKTARYIFGVLTKAKCMQNRDALSLRCCSSRSTMGINLKVVPANPKDLRASNCIPLLNSIDTSPPELDNLQIQSFVDLTSTDAPPTFTADSYHHLHCSLRSCSNRRFARPGSLRSTCGLCRSELPG